MAFVFAVALLSVISAGNLLLSSPSLSLSRKAARPQSAMMTAIQRTNLRADLSWEPTANGVRIRVPAKAGPEILFFCLWFAMWTYGGWQALNGKIGDGLFIWLWIIFWACAEVYVPAMMIWKLLGVTIVSLDPACCDITNTLAGIQLRRRNFATVDVRNLRFVPAAGSGRSNRESQIRFESGDKTVKFAAGVTDAEGLAWIDRMLQVYEFPKERALEYLDLSR